MSDCVVLVHGAFHDARCWNSLVPALEARGLQVATLTLYRGGLLGDAAAVQSIVDDQRAAGHRVTALGHSLGCASVARVDPATLHAAIFLCGPLAGPGMPPIGDCVTPLFFEVQRPENDGLSSIDPARAAELFYHRCPPEIAAEATTQLRPMKTYGPEPTDAPLWHEVASSYFVCNDDRAVPTEYQRLVAGEFEHSEVFDSDHSPMLGQPEALADAVARAIARA